MDHVVNEEAVTLNYWKSKADEYALKLGKPVQVVRGRQGEYSVFPAHIKVGPMSETVYVTGEEEN